MLFEIKQVIEVNSEDNSIKIISTDIKSLDGTPDLVSLAHDLLVDVTGLRPVVRSQYTGFSAISHRRYLCVVTPLKNRRAVRLSIDLDYVKTLRCQDSVKSTLFPYMDEFEFESSEELSAFIHCLNFDAVG